MEKVELQGPITILGSSGAIGSALNRRLAHLSPFTPGRDELARLDDRDLGIVFYCIGKTINFSVDPEATIDAHVNVLSRVLKSASFQRLLFCSSSRLYDGSGVDIATEETCSRLSTSNPRCLYDLTKLLGEQLCRHDPQKRGVVVRISNVYGHPDAGLSGFLPTMIARSLDRRHFSVEARPETARDYLHIDDLLDMLIAVAADPGEFDLYNLACGENITNAALLDCLSEKTGCRIDRLPPTSSGRLEMNVPRIDVSRFRQRFGFCSRPFREAIDALFEVLSADGHCRRPIKRNGLPL